MKLIIKKLPLESKAQQAAGIVSGSAKDMQPVLKNFLFEARIEPSPRLRIVATDMDLSVIAETIMVSVQEAGIALLPAKKMMEIVAAVAGDTDISIETTKDEAIIRTGITEWSIRLMSEDFPKLPESTDMQWYKLAAEPFVKGLRKVRMAVAKDDSRPELQLIKCYEKGILATDGARLHFAKVECPTNIELQIAAVDDLLRLMRYSHDEEIMVGQTDSHILFKVGNDHFMSAKLNVEFTDVDFILNSKADNNMELQLDKSALLTAIKRTRITADEETNRITLVIAGEQMSVRTRDKSNNWCDEKIQVHWTGSPLEIATNWIFLEQAIAEMENASIRLLFGPDKGKRKAPIVIEEDEFIAIINQLHLTDELPAKVIKKDEAKAKSAVK